MSVADMERGRTEHAVVEAIGKKVLERAVEAATEAGAKSVKPVTLEGDPAEQIVAAARQQNANLIVLGSRGLSAFKRLLMGSVSQKVSQLSDCACLIVH